MGISFLVKVFLNLWCGFSLFAFFWIVISSLKTNRQLFENMWGGLFTNPQWENYTKKIWQNYKLGMYFANSLFVVLMAVIGLLVICAPVAYVLSRVEFTGKRFFKSLFFHLVWACLINYY